MEQKGKPWLLQFRPMDGIARVADDFFERGQDWLRTHGRVEHEADHSTQPHAGVVNITRTYVKQQMRSKFVVKR